jgi:uncharacterized protein YjbI with pentapeptide repeats
MMGALKEIAPMALPPYPLPRETRETEILNGSGVATYGPFTIKIFDENDVEVWRQDDGETAWTLQSVTVTKTADLAHDTFSITFPATVPVTTKFRVSGRRLHERQVAVTRGGAIDSTMLEKELSKQGAILQETRRDLNRSLRFAPDFDGVPNLPTLVPGRALIANAAGDGLINGPDASDIALAEGYAAAAEAAKDAAALSATDADTAKDAAEAAAAEAIAAQRFFTLTVVDTAEGDPATDYAAGETIDGHVLETGDRVLRATDGGDPADGVYLVPATGAASRLSPLTTFAALAGCYFSIMEGTTYEDTLWRVTSNKTGTIGADDVVISQFTSGGGSGAASVATRTAMKALTLAGGAVDLTEARHEGTFYPNASDLSSIICPFSATTTTVAGGTGNNTAVAHGFKTAEAVIVTTSVNGLTAETLYYAIRVDADNFKLATTRVNALAGTATSLSGTTNFTAKVVRDDLEGVYVIPTGLARDGSQGAFVRQFDGVNYDPLWFDAVADQATSDWAAFFVMLALMPAGATMRLPLGLCGMSKTLEIAKRVSIIGADKQTSGFYSLGFSSDQSILDFQGTTGARIQNIVLENFTLRADNSAARGMTLTWVNLSTFKGLYFYNLYRGVYGDNAWSNSWEGFSSYGQNQETIRFADECNNNTFTGCQFTGASGFNATGLMTDLTFVGCDFENITSAAGAGIMLAPTTGKWIAGVNVKGGYWEGIKGYAIATFGADSNSVRGLHITGSYFYGGHVSKFGSTSGQAQYGVVFTKMTGAIIQACFFQDWQTSALYFNSTETHVAAFANTRTGTTNHTTGTPDATSSITAGASI